MSREIKISPARDAERRMSAWVDAAGVSKLEADWIAVCFELKRLRNAVDSKNSLLEEALNAMLNLAPRVKEYGGCFGRMAGGTGGEDCICTACKIRREIGDK